MNFLPPELHNEISKFLKNKSPINVMYSLAFYCYVNEGEKRLNVSYVCTSLKLLKWYINKFQLSSGIFHYFTSVGNLKMMKWLKKHNCPWDEHTFQIAAKIGTLKNMKWLKKHNCPYDTKTFSTAAKKGTLKNMKWLKKHNFPWNSMTFLQAKRYGISKNIKWLKENNCPQFSNDLIELIGEYAQDIYITNEPQITYFKQIYRRHTNFSIENFNKH